MNTLIENIRCLIKKNGMKNKAIATAIGISDKQFSDLLHGRRVIRGRDIPAICKALGVDPNELFGWEKSA